MLLTYAAGVDSGTKKRLASLTVALVLVTPLSVLAARWQWNRHLERDALNAAVIKAETTAPVAWQTPLSQGCLPTCEWQRVSATGRWLDNEQLLIRKQVVDGQVGFTVMTPLLTSQNVVLYVMRGWIRDGTAAIPPPPAGDVAVELRIRLVRGVGPMGASDLPAGQVNRIDPAQLAGDRQTVPALFELLSPEPDGLVVLPWPVLTSGPHVSYFVQWILIGLTGIIVYVRVFRSEIRLSRESEAGDDGSE